ncbi:MAG: hypothetical protein IJV33_03210 [Bacteroidaceae bacterium]|nr:hypothetical protein [Bacteroidaceae bacterium]
MTGKTTRTKMALWDTGAACSCVSRELADFLALEKVGEDTIDSATGSETADVCRCIITLSPEDSFVRDVLVLPINDTPAIIGMDIIRVGHSQISPTEEGGIHFLFESKSSID